MKLPEFIENLQFIKDNVWNGANLFVTVEIEGKNKQSNVTGVVYDNEKLRVRVVDGEFIVPPEGMNIDTYRALTEETTPLTTFAIGNRIKKLKEEIDSLEDLYELSSELEEKGNNS